MINNSIKILIDSDGIYELQIEKFLSISFGGWKIDYKNILCNIQSLSRLVTFGSELWTNE